MKRTHHLGIAAVVAAGIWGATPPSRAQEASAEAPAELSAENADCPFFGPQREHFLPRLRMNSDSMPGRITRQFRAAANFSRAMEPRTPSFSDAASGKANLIDRYIWQDLQTNNITPAGKTTDYE